jgi:hypothetical protein
VGELGVGVVCFGPGDCEAAALEGGLWDGLVVGGEAGGGALGLR